MPKRIHIGDTLDLTPQRTEVVRPPSRPRASRAMIYLTGEQSQRISDICRTHGITQQELYRYALNLAFQAYGLAPCAAPEDRRRMRRG